MKLVIPRLLWGKHILVSPWTNNNLFYLRKRVFRFFLHRPSARRLLPRSASETCCAVHQEFLFKTKQRSQGTRQFSVFHVFSSSRYSDRRRYRRSRSKSPDRSRRRRRSRSTDSSSRARSKNYDVKRSSKHDDSPRKDAVREKKGEMLDISVSSVSSQDEQSEQQHGTENNTSTECFGPALPPSTFTKTSNMEHEAPDAAWLGFGACNGALMAFIAGFSRLETAPAGILSFTVSISSAVFFAATPLVTGPLLSLRVCRSGNIFVIATPLVTGLGIFTRFGAALNVFAFVESAFWVSSDEFSRSGVAITKRLQK